MLYMWNGAMQTHHHSQKRTFCKNKKKTHTIKKRMDLISRPYSVCTSPPTIYTHPFYIYVTPFNYPRAHRPRSVFFFALSSRFVRQIRIRPNEDLYFFDFFVHEKTHTINVCARDALYMVVCVCALDALCKIRTKQTAQKRQRF